MHKFKVLVYGNGMFVDENLLGKGIYLTSIPNLHPESMRMEDYIKKIEDYFDALSQLYNVEKVLKNLKECRFAKYNLNWEEA